MRGKPSRRRPSLFAIVIGIVVVLGVVAIVLSSRGNQPEEVSGGDLPAVGVEGEPLPPQGPGPDASVGRAAPVLLGLDLDGERFRIPRRSRPQAVVFLAHWCPHCQREVEALVAWLRTNELPSGVDLVSVSTLVNPARGNYPPEEWLRRERWPFRVLADDAESSAAEAYGLSSTPLWVFVDAGGAVVARQAGELDPDRLAEVMEQLASTSVQPSPAPR